MNRILPLEKVWTYCRKAGRAASRPVVLLYLVLRDPATPRKDKYIVYSALAYLVLPIDIISAKKIPVLGWADEAGAVALAYKSVKGNITPAMEMQADELLNSWFGLDDESTVVE
ncbi:MAG: DUF1232 domain-containing protein [Bacteroidales bacterium]|nr:DUF1232 domain-containing protein [Bacteroidales bacterium]